MTLQKKKRFTALLLDISLVTGVLVESGFPSTIPDNSIPHLDKVLHFMAYGTIACLTAYLLLQYKIRLKLNSLIISFLFITALSFITEFLQFHTPGRDASMGDLLTNLVGATFFLGLFQLQVSRQS
jgi:VanZ family protein